MLRAAVLSERRALDAGRSIACSLRRNLNCCVAASSQAQMRRAQPALAKPPKPVQGTTGGSTWATDMIACGEGCLLVRQGLRARVSGLQQEHALRRSALLLTMRQGTGRPPGLLAACSGGSAAAKRPLAATSPAHLRTLACFLFSRCKAP